jgi:hypothetical protein
MSSRKYRKVRHHKPTPSFKERVSAGVAQQTKQLWEKYGWGPKPKVEPIPQPTPEPSPEAPNQEHIHGPDCQHQ